MVLPKTRITKALIRLRGCAGWSAPVLFEKPPKRGLLASRPINDPLLKWLEVWILEEKTSRYFILTKYEIMYFLYGAKQDYLHINAPVICMSRRLGPVSAGIWPTMCPWYLRYRVNLSRCKVYIMLLGLFIRCSYMYTYTDLHDVTCRLKYVGWVAPQIRNKLKADTNVDIIVIRNSIIMRFFQLSWRGQSINLYIEYLWFRHYTCRPLERERKRACRTFEDIECSYLILPGHYTCILIP